MGTTKMNSKICLILFGLLVALAVLASAENHEESSLSEELGSSRVARSADADAARRKRKTLRKRKRTQKKGLKKRNKNKSKRRKNTKRTKKTKKGKRKNNKRRNNKRKNKGTRKSTRTLGGMCIENAVTAMKRWKDVVANFDKQKTRIEKQASIAGKKSGKQSVFGPIALKLVDLGGGNKSALTCSGSSTSEGALQLTNLTSTLFDCEVLVNASCTTDFPMPNMTFVDGCVNATDLFKTLATECMTMSKEAPATEACACWSAPEMTMASEAVKDCKITEVSAIAQGLKACKDAFSTCRKFEDEAVSSMAACSVSTDALKAKAAALSQSKTAMDAAASTVAGITGSSRRARGLARGKRAAAADAAAFITLVTTIVTIATDFPSSPMIVTVSADIVASSSLTFTDDEITSLTAVEETLTAAVELVTDAFEEAQATLEDATGSTLSAAGLSSVAASITTARARQRVRGFQSQRNMFQ